MRHLIIFFFLVLEFTCLMAQDQKTSSGNRLKCT